MKFEGTLQAVELTKGAKSNTYDSIGNADVSFRRNTIDFMYFRNGNVEVNTGISLYSQSAKLDTIDTTGINDMVFNRNGVEYLRLNGASSILDVGSGITLSSNYLYCNFISQRSMSYDMVFKGANVAGTGTVEYMRYRKADEDVIFSKDIYVNQDIKAYFHKETGKSSYI